MNQENVTYWLSRQQDMLPCNRGDALINSIGVTDRSEGRRLIGQINHATARVGAIIGSSFADAGNTIAKTCFPRRPSTP